MPSTSKAQRRLFGMVVAAQEGKGAASPKVAKLARSMSKSSVKDFANTKESKLPSKRMARRPIKKNV